MKMPARNILAFVLTIMYLVIMMSPLAPLVLHSKVIAHAMTGECTGDCDTCGCSQERRANHTCCCALKKRREQAARLVCVTPVLGCCKKKQTSKIPSASNGCERVAPVSECCKKKPAKKRVATLSTCPCGSGKHLALFSAEQIELLPNQLGRYVYPFLESVLNYQHPHHLISRTVEPPDPPPKISLHS